MASGDSKSQAALGFLTVLEHEQGLTGGYLVLNLLGRPLEFHCTAPVKPNRAQQILFGPTLQPYLFGEQIGQTLISKGANEPLLVFTDLVAALSVRDFVSSPVALVVTTAAPESSAAEPTQTTWRVDAAHSLDKLTQFHVGANRLAVPAGRDGDRSEILARLESFPPFDFVEPFGRIREAVEEAHRSGK